MKFFTLASCLLITLTACGSTGINLGPYSYPHTTRENFVQCHGQGCTSRTRVGITDSEWKRVAKIFKPAAKSAAAERTQIAKAIALIENIVGQKTGTKADKAEATAPKSDTHQMDCIDETVNTNHYIHFLHEAGLLKFHAPAKPIHRGYFVDGTWPHNTATIRENKTGALYVVDAFYADNGKPPAIMPAHEWINGWRPAR